MSEQDELDGQRPRKWRRLSSEKELTTKKKMTCQDGCLVSEEQILTRFEENDFERIKNDFTLSNREKEEKIIEIRAQTDAQRLQRRIEPLGLVDSLAVINDYIKFEKDGEECTEFYSYFANKYELIVNNEGELRKTPTGWEIKYNNPYLACNEEEEKLKWKRPENPEWQPITNVIFNKSPDSVDNLEKCLAHADKYWTEAKKYPTVEYLKPILRHIFETPGLLHKAEHKIFMWQFAVQEHGLKPGGQQSNKNMDWWSSFITELYNQ